LHKSNKELLRSYYKKCEEIKKIKKSRDIEFEYVKKLENEMIQLKDALRE